MKKILVGCCTECPHLGHTGCWGQQGKFLCEHPKVVAEKTFGQRRVKGTNIPRWCPLEENVSQTKGK